MEEKVRLTNKHFSNGISPLMSMSADIARYVLLRGVHRYEACTLISLASKKTWRAHNSATVKSSTE